MSERDYGKRSVPLAIGFVPGIGVVWKDPTPAQYRAAIWHLKSRGPFMRDPAAIAQWEATYRRIRWAQECRGR